LVKKGVGLRWVELEFQKSVDTGQIFG